MSRSGLYDAGDIDDGLEYGRWRGAVASAIRGKRGQAFLRELAAALDAMPEKRLIKGELKADGEFCAIGCLGTARGLDMAEFDIYDYDGIAEALGINSKLVQEVEWVNDEWSHSPEERWQTVRKWVEEQLRPQSREEQ